MMITAVVPFMNSCEERLRALYFTLAWLTCRLPGVGEILVVEQAGKTKVPKGVKWLASDITDGLFCKSRAVNQGAAEAKNETLLIVDADTLPDPDLIPEALKDDKTMLVPMMAQMALRRFDTEAIYKEDPAKLDFKAWAEKGARRYGLSPGGAQVISKALFFQAGGMDEGYTGHGGSDYDFASRVREAGGKVAYPRDHFAVGLHLWHPKDERGMYLVEGASVPGKPGEPALTLPLDEVAAGRLAWRLASMTRGTLPEKMRRASFLRKLRAFAQGRGGVLRITASEQASILQGLASLLPTAEVQIASRIREEAAFIGVAAELEKTVKPPLPVQALPAAKSPKFRFAGPSK